MSKKISKQANFDSFWQIFLVGEFSEKLWITTLTRENVLSVRKEYLPKSERDKSLWIKDYIRNNIITLDTTRTTR